MGKTETEGIYSLRAMSRADGTPKDTIVAFEDIEDAQRWVAVPLKSETLLEVDAIDISHLLHEGSRISLVHCSMAGQPTSNLFPDLIQQAAFCIQAHTALD